MKQKLTVCEFKKGNRTIIIKLDNEQPHDIELHNGTIDTGCYNFRSGTGTLNFIQTILRHENYTREDCYEILVEWDDFKNIPYTETRINEDE